MLFSTGSPLLDQIIIETEDIVRQSPHEEYHVVLSITFPLAYLEIKESLRRQYVYPVLTFGKREIGTIMLTTVDDERFRGRAGDLYVNYYPRE
jgi:hypothetical protein